MPTSTIEISDSWITRHHTSSLLSQKDGPAGSSTISTSDKESYGNPSHPIRFRIGNGGAGYTGILRLLAETYISSHGNDFRIGWVANHSRHSQIALLADVVQIALTYEPENEDVSIAEGWARRVGRVFNDHFVLVGPGAGSGRVEEVLGMIAESKGKMRFISRGDGSATFSKESLLWETAGIRVNGEEEWVKTFPSAPYEALVKAEEEQAFLLSDRATFLTAKRDGTIPSLGVHAQGEQLLLNPCSALVATGRSDESNTEAAKFAEWLCKDEAQRIIENYGRDWSTGSALFTPARKEEFDEEDLL